MLIRKYFTTFAAMLVIGLLSATSAQARDIKYNGAEQTVYVNPGEPTQVMFPSKVEGGFKSRNAPIALERNGNFLVVFAQPDLTEEGAALLVLLDDKRSFAIRVAPASDDNVRDEVVKVTDEREDTDYESSPNPADFVPRDGYAPPTLPSGLVREMVLVAEYGKKKNIPGYRRSNRYTGETVLHDGAIEAKVDEIFMGSDYWGYVISVENLLDTTQRLNPATFRLDGTRVISAQRWELAARPQTAEQELSAAHKAKVYVVIRASKN